MCNAHVVRELAGVHEAAPGQTWAPKLATVLHLMNAAVDDAKDGGQHTLEPGVLAGWQTRIDVILTLGWAQNPRPRVMSYADVPAVGAGRSGGEVPKVAMVS